MIGPLAVSPGEASPLWRLDQARYLRPRSRVPGRPSLLGEERGADCSPQETCLAPARAFRFRCPRCCRWTRLKVPNYGGVSGLASATRRSFQRDCSALAVLASRSTSPSSAIPFHPISPAPRLSDAERQERLRRAIARAGGASAGGREALLSGAAPSACGRVPAPAGRREPWRLCARVARRAGG